ncbi:hypothetical protein EYF80_001791 [Liparis tanakae]|uniref:Uncharacterized protein n=1 Tax=Liparis tanakae TaxID=230148 RepID=A0A4Z2JCU9_9TELE|nr:hypothetical protein EYF80_001791 [Liparis tanakae]
METDESARPNLSRWSHLLVGKASVVQAEEPCVALREPEQQGLRQLHALGMDPVPPLPSGAEDHGWPLMRLTTEVELLGVFQRSGVVVLG